MLTVDNNGDGNCMYYAYGISLMYFLRLKNDRKTTEDIFSKLKLNEEQKFSLRTLLSKALHKTFSKNEVDTIIEPILGKATRIVAAEWTVEEFHKAPYDTAFFTAAQYGIEYYFKQVLQSSGSALESLIDHEFTAPNFTDAEIYRVEGMHGGMKAFTAKRLLPLIEEFNKQWTKKIKDLEGARLSEHNIRLFKSNLFDNIMRKETVDFFSANSNNYLNAYKKHLQTDRVWGSEETLMTLHRGIQGERMVRNSQGRIETMYDTAIVLHLHRNGSSPFFQIGSPAMILNNISNRHWTSEIPDSIFSLPPEVLPSKKKIKVKVADLTLKYTVVEPKILKILDDMKVARDNIPKDHEEFKVADRMIGKLEAQVLILASNQPLEQKEMAVQSVIEIISTDAPKLGKYQSWGSLIKTFLCSMLDLIPDFLGGKQILSGLAKWGMYNEDKRPVIIRSVERVTNQLLDVIDTQIKKAEKDIDILSSL